MRIKSHAAMGRFLLRHAMPQLPRPCARAFLIGCVQPDRNPTTYIKGSLRNRPLRGHNYDSSRRYMYRMANRLERKTAFSLWDYYTMGKLVHYTLDAFTLSHNEQAPFNLAEHREYEAMLQHYFLHRLYRSRFPEDGVSCGAAELIRKSHADYLRTPGGVEADTSFAIRTSCLLVKKLRPYYRRSPKNISISSADMLY